jgi:hypothetical protein
MLHLRLDVVVRFLPCVAFARLLSILLLQLGQLRGLLVQPRVGVGVEVGDEGLQLQDLLLSRVLFGVCLFVCCEIC